MHLERDGEPRDDRDQHEYPSFPPASAFQGSSDDATSSLLPTKGEDRGTYELSIVWASARDGIILDMPAWRGYTGQSREAVHGWGWLDAVHADDRAAARAAWQDAFTARRHFETAYRVRQAGGVYMRYAVRGVPVLTADGRVREWVLHFTPAFTPAQRRGKITTGRAKDGRDTQDTQDTQDSSAVAQHAAPPQPHGEPDSSPELGGILAALTNGVIVYDRAGHITRMNDAARKQLGLDDPTASGYSFAAPEHRQPVLAVRTSKGHPLLQDQLPVARLLAGETLSSDSPVELRVRTVAGQETLVAVSGSPLRDAAGEVSGAVVVLRDVTERRRLEHRTHDAVSALLGMAEALVLVSSETDPIEEPRLLAPERISRATEALGRQLAELTRSVLDCWHVGIVSIDPETERPVPLAVAGLGASRERRWRSEWEEQPALADHFAPEVMERLRADAVVLLEESDTRHGGKPALPGAHSMLVVPMRLGEQLAGLLILSAKEAQYSYTLGEITLAGAVAKLAALVIQRQRLLRERAEAEASALALRDSNRRMDEFLSIASHELRTPLTSIRANVQMATRRMRGMVDESSPLPIETLQRLAPLHDLLDRANRQTDLLNRLVGDLLDVSRIQADKLEFRFETVDLAEIVHDAVAEQRLAWPERAISIEIPKRLATLPVLADADRIEQVVTNFLTNALKYSEDDRPVVVRIEMQRTRGKNESGEHMTRVTRVSVRDKGPGLPPEERRLIWSRFHRAPGVRVMSGSGVGLGLGLHISQTIIERHDGRVGVESAVGMGSTFWFEIPVADEFLPADAFSPKEREARHRSARTRQYRHDHTRRESSRR